MYIISREHYKICSTVRRLNNVFGSQLACSVICRGLIIIGECYIIHRNSLKISLENILNENFLTTEVTVLLEAVDVIIIITVCGKISDLVSVKTEF